MSFTVAFLDYNQKINSQSSSTTSDSGFSHKGWHSAIWRYPSRVLIILLALGAGLVNATAQSHISAYVTNVSGTVSVINTSNNSVVATIPVGRFPSGVAITPDGTRIYVTNIFNSISVIDAATNRVVATIPSSQFPTGIAITPDGTRAYVVNQFVTNQGTNTVSVINTMTSAIVATIPVGLGPSQIAITPDGTRAYVPNQQDFTISVIDTATNTVVTTIPLSGGAGIGITPDGTQAYVTSPGAGTVSVIDTATNTVAATISLGASQNPSGVAITPDGTRAYVTISFPNNFVSVIDTATNTVAATIPVGAAPNGIAITPDGTRIYVTNDGSDTVSVIDTATNTVADTITVGSSPFGVTITPPPQATSTSLISSLNPSVYGQKVTWTATVTSSGSVRPTGKVNFTWSGQTIGSATLNSSGVATLTRSNLNADVFPLTAVYTGDGAHLGSTSAVVNQVLLETTSKATLNSWPNSSMQGQVVTFTATISSPTALPRGPVTFTAGKTVLGTVQLVGGKASLTISSLPEGSTKVTATYYGNSNIAKSSASVTQTVR
jgi:YVTN family beta-propeller protein